ncbi:MAG TPA: hypothetical protein VJZ68_04895 [Nitrososphaera sp.]|nr:hypothetical protein [Nitrososphaera sp.]
MSAEQVAIVIAPIVTAGIAAHQGITVEKHYVGKHTIRYNIALLAATLIPVFFYQFSFLALTVYCAFGIALVRQYGTKNQMVAFLFGNKSIGALGLWVALEQFKVGQTITTGFYQMFYPQTAVPDAGIITVVTLISTFVIIHLIGEIVKRR